MSSNRNKYCIADYQKAHSLSERNRQYKTIIAKNGDKFPVIIEKLKNVSNILPDLEKNKFLMQNDMFINQVIYILNKKLELNSSESIYLFANDTLLNTSESLASIYQKHKDPDGFLYLFYTAENVFG